MNSPVLGQMFLQIILILFNAVFACAEIAVISTNSTKLSQLSANGNKKATRLIKLTSEPAKFLATIQVAITLSGFLASAFAADNFSEYLVDWLVNIGVTIPISTLDTISVILITFILSYFTLVFGELVPKRLAMKKAEQLALGMASLVSFISKLFAPIVWFLTISTNFILKLFGINPNANDEEVSEEDIRLMVDASSEKGVIDIDEKEIIHNVFEFDDITVNEFLTHRTDVSMLWLNKSNEEWEKTIHESRHTLYPVCDGTIDNVVGILNIKDYFRLSDKSINNVMKEAVLPPYFVPDGIFADVLFKQMKKTHNHLAVVIDEYGGLSGIVTINDLVEQLVGEFDDEFIHPKSIKNIEKVDSKTYEISGNISLDKVSKMLSVKLPTEDYDTFGGFVFASYGSIPNDGAEFEIDINSLHIKVTKIVEHCIEKATVSVL